MIDQVLPLLRVVVEPKVRIGLQVVVAAVEV
jgi:hypothetical protein